MSKKNFTKKSIKNYQKLNNKLSGNGPTDGLSHIERYKNKNKAVYTAALAACWWAGAVKSKRKHKKPIAN